MVLHLSNSNFNPHCMLGSAPSVTGVTPAFLHFALSGTITLQGTGFSTQMLVSNYTGFLAPVCASASTTSAICDVTPDYAQNVALYLKADGSSQSATYASLVRGTMLNLWSSRLNNFY